jgi:hypothetical protein
MQDAMNKAVDSCFYIPDDAEVSIIYPDVFDRAVSSTPSMLVIYVA